MLESGLKGGREGKMRGPKNRVFIGLFAIFCADMRTADGAMGACRHCGRHRGPGQRYDQRDLGALHHDWLSCCSEHRRLPMLPATGRGRETCGRRFDLHGRDFGRCRDLVAGPAAAAFNRGAVCAILRLFAARLCVVAWPQAPASAPELANGPLRSRPTPPARRDSRRTAML